jgi:two-component system, sensor histidine kinase and response regulator
MSHPSGKPQVDIVVVDDTVDNLRILISLLNAQGYRVRPATSGPVALAAIQQELPDLILLDIMMPEMDGFAVCRALKADDRTRHIPVIFITALHDIEDKVRAFVEGGVDYITKPFRVEEVLARVATHLALQQTQKQLQDQIAELDAFAHTVAHDIKGPMGIVSGYGDLLVSAFHTLDEAQLLHALQNVRQVSRKVVKIVDALLLLSSARNGPVTLNPLDMAAILSEVQQRLASMITEYGGQVIVPPVWPETLGYAPWVEEVWINYLTNGLKYGGRPPRLELGATLQADGKIRFWVKDNGPGLRLEEQAALFIEFSRLNQIQIEGYGLGLSIVKRIIDRLEGEVGVESMVGQGSTFYFTLLAANQSPE